MSTLCKSIFTRYRDYNTIAYRSLATRSREKQWQPTHIDIAYRMGCCKGLVGEEEEEGTRKGLKPLRTLSCGTRRAGFGPNEKASAEKRAKGARHSWDICGVLVSP